MEIAAGEEVGTFNDALEEDGESTSWRDCIEDEDGACWGGRGLGCIGAGVLWIGYGAFIIDG